MGDNEIYKKVYSIGLSDIDFTKKLKLSTLFSYFQDVASGAVDKLGVGINTLEKEYGIAWILIHIRVDILRNPLWNEKITIETWPQEPKKFEFERDYIVLDESGNIIAKAVSKWVILDIKTRELRRTDILGIENSKAGKPRPIECKMGNFKPFGQPELSYRKVIGYSDVDLNGHLNNCKYVDFIMDCFNIESHKKYDVSSIEVRYINEVLPGDTLILNRDISNVDSNLVYIEGINSGDSKIVFKAQMSIKEK